MITIREARPEDLKALREIAILTSVDTFSEFNTKENMRAFLEQAYNPNQLEHELSEVGTLYCLACEEDMLVGFVRVRSSKEAEKQLGKNTVELQRLYVHPDHQGKKVGSSLMKFALNYAAQNGHEWLWLGVWERNFKAQEFYRKWGFEKFGEHIFQMGDDPQTDWLLKKKIP